MVPGQLREGGLLAGGETFKQAPGQEKIENVC